MIKLGNDLPSDQRLPTALRRLSVQCTVQVGSAHAPVTYRHSAMAGLALIDTGASLCAIGSRLIPPGCFPVAYHTGAVNLGGPIEEKAVYLCRMTFVGYPDPIELQCIGHDIGATGCDIVLGTPFLSLGRLVYDTAQGESHFSIHPA